MRLMTDSEQLLSMAAVKRFLVLALVVGIAAGAAGGALFVRYGASHIPTDKKQVLVQESSAVTGVIKQVSPSVVSITSTGTVPSFFGTSQTVEGAGSGIIVTSDGLVMTN